MESKRAMSFESFSRMKMGKTTLYMDEKAHSRRGKQIIIRPGVIKGIESNAIQMQLSPRRHACTLIAVLLMCPSMGAQSKHTVKPQPGFVPDQATALKIAEAVLIPIYGADMIEQEKPFVATLRS